MVIILTGASHIGKTVLAHLIWLEQFLEDNDIHPKTFCYVND